MKFNQASINAKVNRWIRSTEGKRRIAATLKEYQDSGRKYTDAGSPIVNETVVRSIVEGFIALVRMTAQHSGVPQSVMRNINSLRITRLTKNDMSYDVELNFWDDLSRPSLQPSLYPQGVDNIISLLNSGYYASHSIKGVWASRGFRVKSRQSFGGYHFMEDAVKTFLANPTVQEYGIKIELAEEYEYNSGVGASAFEDYGEYDDYDLPF